MRARELGIRIGLVEPGVLNSITDVEGVRVGHTTLIDGEGPLVRGKGPVRTGVTVVIPHDGSLWDEPLFAGCHRLNGNGEMTGLEWVRESGALTSPIGITNTDSVGVVRDALIAAELQRQDPQVRMFLYPVVGETSDGRLNDVHGFHVRAEHVHSALDSASSGPTLEGSVGGGTGMVCHGFKGGIGTSSRVVAREKGGYTVGVLVQANHGVRERLQVAGVPVGQLIARSEVPTPEPPWHRPLLDIRRPDDGGGSIIAIAATDAPLLPGQCARLAQRIGFGVARSGGAGENHSGDLFFAFSTANRGRIPGGDVGFPRTASFEALAPEYLDALFYAVIDATEEAILNSMLAAETMVGRDGIVARRLEPDRLLEAMRSYHPLA
jgi:D-aminopeptidase